VDASWILDDALQQFRGDTGCSDGCSDQGAGDRPCRVRVAAQQDDLLDGGAIRVPSAVVLGTNVFDRFLDQNDLRDLAVNSNDQGEIRRRFRTAPLPAEYTEELRKFLALARYPLAVRSSSLLEDSQHQPFAGIYDTCMLANNQQSDQERLLDLQDAIRQVYASTYSRKARAYMRATAGRSCWSAWAAGVRPTRGSGSR
jgi:hypothetical protein